MFYFVYHSDIKNKLIGFAISYGIVFFICATFNIGVSTWWVTTPTFVLGLLWGTYVDNINRMMNKHWWEILGLSLVLTAGGWKLSGNIQGRFSDIAQIVSSSLFLTIALITILYRKSVSCKITDFLGKYSYEIYAMQGVAFIMVEKIEMNRLYKLGIIIAGTLLLAICFRKFYDILCKSNEMSKKIRNNNRKQII